MSFFKSTVLMGFIVCSLGCLEPLDTKRSMRAKRSVGQQIYQTLCERVASVEFPADVGGLLSALTCQEGAAPAVHSSQRLQRLHQARPEVIELFDDLLAPPLDKELSAVLQTWLNATGLDLMHQQAEAMATLLQHWLNSPAFFTELTHLLDKKGYSPQNLRGGTLAAILGYPHWSRLLMRAERFFDSPHDASQYAETMLLAAHHTLQNADPTDSNSAPNSWSILADALLLEHRDFTDGIQRWSVMRDERGMAVPLRQRGAQLPPPFVDNDGDDMADIDERQQMIDENGHPLHLATPFAVNTEDTAVRDAAGRAQDHNGRHLYAYRDVSKTMLAALLFEAQSLLQRHDTLVFDAIGLLRGAFGPVQLRQFKFNNGTVMQYDSYDVEQSAALDILHALRAIIAKPTMLPAMQLTSQLLEQHEPEVAEVVGMLDELRQWLTQAPYDEMTLEPQHTLMQDFVDALIPIAKVPGLLEEVMTAFANPQMWQLGSYFARHMQFKDAIDYNPEHLNGPPLMRWRQPVDRNHADSGDNQSIMQRLLHMIYDTRGAKLCNKDRVLWMYDRCDLFEIEDTSIFYLRSMLQDSSGQSLASLQLKPAWMDFMSTWGQSLEVLSGIDGMTMNPHFKAVNRFVFAPRNSFMNMLIDPPAAADGALLQERHPGTVFAWEERGFADALRPLLYAFAKYGQEGLLVDVFGVLHLHYATPQSTTTQSADPEYLAYSKQSGVVRFEGLIARLMSQTDGIGRMGRLLQQMAAIQIDGVSGTTIVAALLRDILLPERNSTLTRRGHTRNAGLKPWEQPEPLTPLQLLVDAWQKQSALNAELNQDPAKSQQIVHALAEHFLQVQYTTAGPRFTNRRALAMLKSMLRFTEQHMQADVAQRQTEPLVLQWMDAFGDMLVHPLMTQTLLLVDQMKNAPGFQTELSQLLQHVLKTPHSNFDALLTDILEAVYLLRQDTVRPVFLKAMAPAFAPTNGIALPALQQWSIMHQSESQWTAMLMQRLVQLHAETRRMPIDQLLGVFTAVCRQNPASQEPLSAADYRAMVQGLYDFVTDERSGMQRLIQIIESK